QQAQKSTIARKVASIRSFFNYCFKRGLIEKKPTQLLLSPVTENKLPKTIPAEGLSRMMELPDSTTASGAQEKAILELFYSTGIRLNELIQLNKSDININLAQITVLGKGAKQRSV